MNNTFSFFFLLINGCKNFKTLRKEHDIEQEPSHFQRAKWKLQRVKENVEEVQIAEKMGPQKQTFSLTVNITSQA